MVCVVNFYLYSCSYYFSTDQVEKVIHETSTNVSSANDDEKEQMDDVDMADGTTSEPKKVRKKREKNPVGKNGLKKKKVMKTKKTIDDNGYMRKYFLTMRSLCD
jgi:DNA polymerase delta subunit 3